jgi:hypothetical protein
LWLRWLRQSDGYRGLKKANDDGGGEDKAKQESARDDDDDDDRRVMYRRDDDDDDAATNVNIMTVAATTSRCFFMLQRPTIVRSVMLLLRVAIIVASFLQQHARSPKESMFLAGRRRTGLFHFLSSPDYVHRGMAKVVEKTTRLAACGPTTRADYLQEHYYWGSTLAPIITMYSINFHPSSSLPFVSSLSSPPSLVPDCP